MAATSPSKESLDNKVYDIFNQHQNLDKAQRNNANQTSANEMGGTTTMSQQFVKTKINTAKLTQGQKELMNIVKTIQ